MEQPISKISDTVHGAPLGALAGVLIGYYIARQIGYDKTLMVLSFGMVGLIIGASVVKSLKK